MPQIVSSVPLKAPRNHLTIVRDGTATAFPRAPVSSDHGEPTGVEDAARDCGGAIAGGRSMADGPATIRLREQAGHATT